MDKSKVQWEIMHKKIMQENANALPHNNYILFKVLV